MDTASDHGGTGGGPPRAHLTVAGTQARDAVHNRPVGCPVHRGDEGALLSNDGDAVGDIVDGVPTVTVVRVITDGD